MTRFFTLAIASFALGSVSAHALTWDTNDDGKVDAVEFATGNTAAATFNRFDDNDDGAISPAEVGLNEPDAVFERADDDSDGFLTKDELTMATFLSYDRDQSGGLEESEMSTYEYEQDIRSNPFAGESGRTRR